MYTPAAEPPVAGYRRNLWSLGLVLFLLVMIPALLAGRASNVRKLTENSSVTPVAAMVDELIDNSQKSALFVVAALAFLSFRKLVPILWSLFQSSLAGMLVAAEIGLVFWLVYGGLAIVGMPGLVWSPNRLTMMQTGLGVTLLVYWLLYLVFVRDFEVHRREPDHQVWTRFQPVLVESGLPALTGLNTVGVDAVVTLRWFLAYAGLPALVVLAVPAVLPAMRPGDGPVIVEWAWLAGMATAIASVAVLLWTRAATRFHELWRQLSRRSFDLQQIRSLDPNRLDPHANTKNILIIVGVLLAVSYIEEYLGLNWMRLLFPPAILYLRHARRDGDIRDLLEHEALAHASHGRLDRARPVGPGGNARLRGRNPRHSRPLPLGLPATPPPALPSGHHRLPSERCCQLGRFPERHLTEDLREIVRGSRASARPVGPIVPEAVRRG